MARVWLAVVLCGCGGGTSMDSGEGQTHDDHPPDFPDPTVSIVAPTGPTVGIAFDVVIETTDFLMTETTVTQVSPLRTLWDLVLPSAYADVAGAEPQGVAVLYLDGVEVDRGASTTFWLSDVALGEHELKVELRWPDDHPFFPPADDLLLLTVE